MGSSSSKGKEKVPDTDSAYNSSSNQEISSSNLETSDEIETSEIETSEIETSEIETSEIETSSNADSDVSSIAENLEEMEASDRAKTILKELETSYQDKNEHDLIPILQQTAQKLKDLPNLKLETATALSTHELADQCNQQALLTQQAAQEAQAAEELQLEAMTPVLQTRSTGVLLQLKDKTY